MERLHGGGVGFDGTSPSGNGVVFRISGGGGYELLHAFRDIPDGRDALAHLIQGPDQNFYGTTYAGGAEGVGAVYRVTPSGKVTIMTSFPYDGSVGNCPRAPLCVGVDGVFYGTTVYGGLGGGTVFGLTADGALRTLGRFPDVTGGGLSPCAGLIAGPDGVMYGTTLQAAVGEGTIFKITPGGLLSSVLTFSGTNGGDPQAELTWGGDGKLYGTTSDASWIGSGSVFRVTTNGNLETLVFFGYTNGANPRGPLILGSDGDFYGTTVNGGEVRQGHRVSNEVRWRVDHDFPFRRNERR